MMTIYYSYLLSILYLLLIIHWTNAASLRSLSRSSSKWSLDRRQPSFIMNTEVSTPEPILFRRRPILISRERQRRWSKDDDDEIEIPIDNPPTIVSNDISSYNPIISEIEPSLLRQDLDIINQTDELTTTVINEDISENNNNNTNIENIFQSTVESEILLTNDTDINQNISNVFNINESIKNNETEISSTSISITQLIEETSTINEIELDTAIIVFDYTTIPPVTIDASQTTIDSGTEMLLEYNTTNVSVTTNIIDEIQNDTMPIQQPTDSTIITSTVTRNDTEVTDRMIDDNTTTILSDTIQNSTEKIDQTIIFDTTQSHTEVVDQAIDNITMISDGTSQSDTSTAVYIEEDYSNEVLPANNAKPICDQSCQCFRKCPYGYEIINDTCECNPPCENYQCFGNDTCSVLKTGQPICKPENEFEHDRPIRCYQPQVAGYHDNDVRYYDRWYYNPDQNTCHSFIYRGLGGNENNFQTLNECRLECIICASLPDSGSCFGYTSMWYYDYKKNQCSEFTYSGCKGNENKFMHKQDCIDTCITRILNL